MLNGPPQAKIFETSNDWCGPPSKDHWVVQVIKDVSSLLKAMNPKYPSYLKTQILRVPEKWRMAYFRYWRQSKRENIWVSHSSAPRYSSAHSEYAVSGHTDASSPRNCLKNQFFSRFNVVNTRNKVEGEFFWTCGFLHCLEYIIACLHMQFEANP